MRRPGLWRGALLGALLLTLGGDPAPAQDPARPRTNPAVYDQVWQLTRNAFYDRDHHGVDWEAAGKRHRPRAEQARSQREVHEAITALLAELKSSHVAVIESDMYDKHVAAEAKNLPAAQLGFKLVLLDGKFFVSEVLAGSPAAAVGILRGDRLVAVDDLPPHSDLLRPVPYDSGLGGPRSYRVPTQRAGQQVRLELERSVRPNNYGLYRVTVAAAKWNEVEASRVSRRVIYAMGFKVGYMRLYHVLSGDIIDMLEEFLADSLQDGDGMILDLRGRGGIPDAIHRTLACFDPHTPGGPLWGNRPVVALIDGGTRSAKEVLAFDWKRRNLGPLVGQTTKGAVLGATFKELQDGSWMMIPVMDMRAMTGGVVLEGVGVAPDVVVEDEIPYTRGRDAIYERGLEVLLDEILARRRAKSRRHGWY